CLNVRIGSCFKLASEPPQRFDERAAERRNRRFGSLQFGAIETLPVYQTAPHRQKDEVDVAPGAVLQRDQGLGDTGAGIEGERKAPESIAVNLWFTMLL